jgi:hypothetical protein
LTIATIATGIAVRGQGLAWETTIIIGGRLTALTRSTAKSSGQSLLALSTSIPINRSAALIICIPEFTLCTAKVVPRDRRAAIAPVIDVVSRWAAAAIVRLAGAHVGGKGIGIHFWAIAPIIGNTAWHLQGREGIRRRTVMCARRAAALVIRHTALIHLVIRPALGTVFSGGDPFALSPLFIPLITRIAIGIGAAILSSL